MSDSKIIVEVNNLLADAIRDAQMYAKHDKVRPSAIRGFDKVQEAHEKLTEVDDSRDVE